RRLPETTALRRLPSCVGREPEPVEQPRRRVGAQSGVLRDLTVRPPEPVKLREKVFTVPRGQCFGGEFSRAARPPAPHVRAPFRACWWSCQSSTHPVPRHTRFTEPCRLGRVAATHPACSIAPRCAHTRMSEGNT